MSRFRCCITSSVYLHTSSPSSLNTNQYIEDNVSQRGLNLLTCQFGINLSKVLDLGIRLAKAQVHRKAIVTPAADAGLHGLSCVSDL